jgi:hypothetical protein
LLFFRILLVRLWISGFLTLHIECKNEPPNYLAKNVAGHICPTTNAALPPHDLGAQPLQLIDLAES